MSDATTKRLLRPFIQAAPAPMFLSSFFRSPPENFHTSEQVEIDIQRDGEDVAVAIQDLSAGHHYNENSKYSNKAFTPPIFKEAGALSAFRLVGRGPGENPFSDAEFQARAVIRSAALTGKIQRKIRRSIELQASQVLQNGQVTLVDHDGIAVYHLDYSQKSSHRATVQTTWALDGSGGDRLLDIETLADTIRTDGLVEPDTLIFGRSAFQRFTANEKVQKAISRDGIGLGALAPKPRRGGTFQGFVWCGGYRFDLWTYNGHYNHPQTKVPTRYVADDNIIMLSSEARLDLTFGAIPKFLPPEGQVLQFLPGRVTDSEASIDMTLGAWLSPDHEVLHVSVGTRALAIPTEIDSFGCLDVVTG